MLSTRDPSQNKGHIQTESEGLEKKIFHLSNRTFLLETQVFPDGSDGKESACNAGDGVQSLDREEPLEKGMATHSTVLA